MRYYVDEADNVNNLFLRFCIGDGRVRSDDSWPGEYGGLGVAAYPSLSHAHFLRLKEHEGARTLPDRYDPTSLYT